MSSTKRLLPRILETLFPKTMHRYWWKARTTGRTYGLNTALFVLTAELKALHKKAEVADLSARAKQDAKQVQHLITLIRKMRDAE